MSTITVRARVAPSGQAIAVDCFDPAGNPALITGFATTSESQTLSFGGTPVRQAETLTLGSLAIGPIPIARAPGSTEFINAVTLPAPGTYDVQACSGYGSGVANHQVYDGVIPLGSPVAIDSSAAGVYTDPTGGVFRAVGRYTFATTAAVLAISTGTAANFTVSACRFVPVAGGAAIIQAPDNPANFRTVADLVQQGAGSSYSNGSGMYAGRFFACPSGFAGPAYRQPSWYFPLAAVQAAMDAAFGAGVVACSETSAEPNATSAPGPFPIVATLAFGGTRAGQAVGAPAGSASVQALVAHPGGQPPRIRINGGPSIPLPADPAAVGRPWAYFAFPQADLFPGTVAGRYVQTADGYGFRAAGRIGGVGANGIAFAGYAQALRYGACGDSPDAFAFEALPAGTYRIEYTWPVVTIPAGGGYTGVATAARLAVVDGSGAVLHAGTADQSKAPVGVADPVKAGSIWQDSGTTYAVAAGGTLIGQVSNPNNDGGISLADACRLTRVSADNSVNFLPADVVTFDAPAGWLTTAAGPAPAAVAEVLDHAAALVGGPIAPTMETGFNASGDNPAGANIWHSNLLHRIAYPGGMSGVAAVDANLNPTLLTAASGGHCYATVVSPAGDGESSGFADPCLPNDPAGIYSFWYDDASGGSAPPPILLDAANNAYPMIVLPTTVTGKATGNRIYFRQVVDLRNTSPTIAVYLSASGPANPDGTYPISYKNLALYPPDPATGGAWLNPPVWHPLTVAKLAGGPIRVLDLTGAAASNIGDVGDVATPADLSLCTATVATVAITSIAPNSSPDGYFNPAIGPILKITTAAPHGFRDLDAIVFSMTDGSAFPTPTFAQGGQPFAAGTNFEGYNHYVHATGLTTADFVVEFNKGLTPGFVAAVMTNALTAAGMVGVKGTGRATPYEDIAALAIQAGASSLHVPVPGQATLALLDHVAACLLLTSKGMRIRLEIFNEPWNFTVSEWARCCYLSHALGLSPGGDEWVPGYCATAAAAHARVMAAFVAAGRGADLIRAFGAQQADYNTTAAIAGFCVAHGIPVDEIAIGPYFDPATGSAADTVPQGLDRLELEVEYGSLRTTWADHYGAIARSGLERPDGSAVRVAAYEGGLESAINGGSGTPRGMLRTQATMYDVRMYRIARRIPELAQLGGCTAWQEYRLGDHFLGNTWDKCNGTLRGPGAGDPTRDLANLAPFSDKFGLRSQVLGAYRDFNAAAIAGSTPVTPTPAGPGRLTLASAGARLRLGVAS